MSKRLVSEVFRKDMRFRLDHPYRRPGKYPSDTKCPECGLLFQNGAWKWAEPKPNHELQWKLCPACLQVRDGYAGGVLKLSGSFLARHREEILNRVRNVEKRVLGEHPLERIMRMEERSGEIIVYATSEHLIARLAKALHRDFRGTLDLKYAREDKFATAHWRREA